MVVAGARIALIGFGLIGGSIAAALARTGGALAGAAEVVAWSPSGRGPREAVARGLLARAAGSLEDAIAGADLIVLATPPLDCLRLLDAIADERVRGGAAGATITDVTSTKAAICRRADELHLPFVGGHPMAGRERSGFDAALPDLFVDRPWVVVPGADATPLDVERVEALARACGARPLRLAAEEHDRAAASISHLPLLVAVALVEAVTGGPARVGDAPAAGVAAGQADWAVARELAASGWRDMTRLARGDPAMAAGILAMNARPVAERLADLQAVLEGWQIRLADGEAIDPVAIEAELRAVRARLEDGG